MVDLQETLIVVTADHSHTLSLSGYTERGNDVRGLSQDLPDDNLPYTILSYANGPSFYKHYKPDENNNVTR